MAKVAVIGGGASGMVAAISAAREGAEVHLFEACDRVGKKLLVTGNGRCNISNANVTPDCYNDPAFVESALRRLAPEAVMAFFEDLGLLAFEEEEGRIYPYSNKAATVLDLLRLGMDEAGVMGHCNTEVAAVAPLEAGGWAVAFVDGSVQAFDSVVCAVGGNPARALLPEDVEFHACHPVLAGLKTDTATIKALSGIRVRARIYTDEDPEELRDAWLDVVDPEFEEASAGHEEAGELLFRDWGISGIAVFDMSRYVQPGQMVFIDMLPDMSPQEKVDFIYDQAMAHPKRTAAEVMGGLLPSRVARAVVSAAGRNPDEPIIAEQEATVLAMASESFGLSVRGIADPRQAQVMRGGFATQGFNPETFECVSHVGLFACGEALDVDGRCGGFNLHWAWTSGLLAGSSAAGASACEHGKLSLDEVPGLAARVAKAKAKGHGGQSDAEGVRGNAGHKPKGQAKDHGKGGQGRQGGQAVRKQGKPQGAQGKAGAPKNSQGGQGGRPKLSLGR